LNFLFDTHVWIWTLTAIDTLNEATQTALQDPANTFFISPITLWETFLLIEKRRLPVRLAPQEWIQIALQSSKVQAAPLTHAVAIRSRLLPLPHQDPAARFIAATALEYGLTLMTADQSLLALAEVNTWQVS
jgi:PIN domain nuclease of toxin-antitoxin system